MDSTLEDTHQVPSPAISSSLKYAMNGTPRLRSAYPASPQLSSPNQRHPSSVRTGKGREPSSLTGSGSATVNRRKTAGPLIPLNLLDAPTQRGYVAALYIILWAWRLVDYSLLVSNDVDSPWQWMKWTVFDGIFLFGIPELRIPWLEWSSTAVACVFLLHAVLNGILMFRIPIPLEIWTMAFTRMIYDRELAVSEKRVKPGALTSYSTLITGKQTVHILPEGSAMLNPEHIPICIDKTSAPATLPIFINQTDPIEIELVRFDLDGNANETIQITGREARKLRKQAERSGKSKTASEPRILDFPVRKTGMYRLNKVIDESQLEVHRVFSDTLVVSCPYGTVRSDNIDKCQGDLSDFAFKITAVPPLKIKYRKMINDEDFSTVQLTVHPDNLDLPLVRPEMLTANFNPSHPSELHLARAQDIDVPVNETFSTIGSWRYFLEEICDRFGNTVNYTRSDDAKLRHQSAGVGLESSFDVHQRPQVAFDGCSTQRPLKLAKGEKGHLPIRLNPGSNKRVENANHDVSYAFINQADDSDADGEKRHMSRKDHQIRVKSDKPGPEISEPGIYRLDSVSTEFCAGEVIEPSSCLLINPQEPDVSISSGNIPHQCAGNSIGLKLELDMIGTPPFEIVYYAHRKGEKRRRESKRVTGMRKQLEFRPQDAGIYSYEFSEIMDAVYREPRSLEHKKLIFQQDIKPTARASLLGPTQKPACLGDHASFEILLTGESPWVLEYDIVHQGKRRKYKETYSQDGSHLLTTPKLANGGLYSIALTSLTDASGCKIFLDQVATVEVQHKRPSVAFGQIEGKNSALTLQGKKLSIPLRFSGEKPWQIRVRRTGPDGGEEEFHQEFDAENAFFDIHDHGIYTLDHVADSSCPGVVDASSRSFEVQWIARPTLVAQGTAFDGYSNTYRKDSVCQGAQDALELSFSGTAPYHIKYNVHKKPRRGNPSVSTKVETVGLNAATINLDTTQAGSYDYRFVELGDQLYDHDRNKFVPLVVTQFVNPLPSAEFTNVGKQYSYCKENTQQDEKIQIALTGTPPFSLEIGMRHHSSNKLDVIPIANIKEHRYEFHIPHRALSLGSHIVSIQKVADANGCGKRTEVDAPGVRVNVVDVPSISPMEQTTDFCIGDRISYTLAGTPPFNIFYTFEGLERKASSSSNSFRRIAEKPGNFTITAVSDKTSTDACKARVEFTKTIHQLPSVHMSKGKSSQIDIHEGGEAQLSFEFGGTPPFEFTYTRSTIGSRGKAAKILETRTEVATDFTKTIRVSEEGTYEVVSVRDRYCAVSTPRKRGSTAQLLTFKE